MAAPYGNSNFHEGRIWRAAINQALEIRGKGDRMAALREIAHKLIEQAEAGDMAALKELGDRVEGKSIQTLAGDKDAPLTVQVTPTDARL